MCAQTVVAGPDGNMKGNGFVKFSAAMPKWVDHMLGTMFVHQVSRLLPKCCDMLHA